MGLPVLVQDSAAGGMTMTLQVAPSGAATPVQRLQARAVGCCCVPQSKRRQRIFCCTATGSLQKSIFVIDTAARVIKHQTSCLLGCLLQVVALPHLCLPCCRSPGGAHGVRRTGAAQPARDVIAAKVEPLWQRKANRHGRKAEGARGARRAAEGAELAKRAKDTPGSRTRPPLHCTHQPRSGYILSI